MDSKGGIAFLPYLVGYHTTDKNGKVTYQDGYISGIMLFIILLTLGICLGIGQYITTEQTKPIEKYVVEGTITVYMGICIVFILLVTCTGIRKQVTERHKAQKEVAPKRRTSEESVRSAEGLERSNEHKSKDKMFEIFKRILPLIGIVLFLLGVIGLDMFRLIAYAACLGEYVEADVAPLKQEAITSIIYHVVRTTFASLITYFCCTFLYNETVFKKIWQMRYGLMILLASLLCIWSESQLYESQGIFETYTKEEEENLYNCTIPANISFAKKCHYKVTSSFCLSERIGVYMFPLNVEFSLLVSECLLHLFFSMGKKRTKKRIDYKKTSEIPPVTENTGSDTESGHDSQQRSETADTAACTDTTLVKVQVHKDTSSDTDNEKSIARPSLKESTGSYAASGTGHQSHLAYELTHRKKSLEQNVSEEPPGIEVIGSVNQGPTDVSSSSRTQSSDKDRLIEDHDNQEEEGNKNFCSCCIICCRCTQVIAEENQVENEDRITNCWSRCISYCRSEQDSDEQTTFHRLPLFFFSIVLGLLYIVLSVCNITLPKEEEGDSVGTVYFIYKIFYWFVALVITVVGFVAARYFKSKQEPFTGFQMLIILSSIGFYIFYFFSLPAAIAVLKGSQEKDTDELVSHYKEAILLILDTSLNAIQIYHQVVFMFHAISIDPRSIKENHPTYYRVFKQTLLYLATSNLFIWCVDSFFEVNNFQHMGPVQISYYTEERWEVITHMSYPLTLFFRFNSFINLLLIYLTI